MRRGISGSAGVDRLGLSGSAPHTCIGPGWEDLQMGRFFLSYRHHVLGQNSNLNLTFKVEMKAILSREEVRLYFI